MASTLSLTPATLPSSYIQGDTTVTLISHASLPGGMQLKVKRRKNLIIHIGFQFFEPRDEQVAQHHSCFYRTATPLLSHDGGCNPRPNPGAAQGSDFYNKERFGNIGFKTLNPVLQAIHNRSGYTIEQKNNTITFICTHQNGDQVYISFPAHAWLIEGKEKDELDAALLDRILSPPSHTHTAIPLSYLDLSPYKEDIWVHNVLPLSEGVQGNLYIKQSQGKRTLVNDPDYIKESLSNLLLRPEDNAIHLKASYQGYDETNQWIDLPYQQLSDHFLEAYDPYVTFTRQTGDTLYASVLWVHKTYFHLHMLSINWPLKDYRPGNRVTITGTLIPYIRRDNIKELFSNE